MAFSSDQEGSDPFVFSLAIARFLSRARDADGCVRVRGVRVALVDLNGREPLIIADCPDAAHNPVTIRVG